MCSDHVAKLEWPQPVVA